MTKNDLIQINKFGQQLINLDGLLNEFSSLDITEKRNYLQELTGLIRQSKPNHEDIEFAIKESKLKPTYTPCVLLWKGVSDHHLQKIIELPEMELNKALVLLLSLFKIAYKRRFDIEKNSPTKWWYWDLSDESKIGNVPG